MSKKDTNPDRVVAIFCSDLHASLTPPPLRAQEPNWLQAMYRVICQIKELKNKYGCPIIVAGDIFDKWDSTAELINWMIDVMPIVYAIPGQHDMPEHNPDQLNRSAYATLFRAHIITPLNYPAVTYIDGNLAIWAFPYGTEIKPCPISPRQAKGFTRIAVIHQYNWIADHVYKTDTKNMTGDVSILHKRKEFAGYDLIVCGDNHNPFLQHDHKSEQTFINCGALMRRHSNELAYQPSAWLLFADGRIERKCLDVSEDIYAEVKQENTPTPDAMDWSVLLEGLGQLGKTCLDFKEALSRMPARKEVRTLIDQAIEDGRITGGPLR